MSADGPSGSEPREPSAPIAAEFPHPARDSDRGAPNRPPRDPHGQNRRADARERRAARRTALRFIRTLLRYQTGAPTGSWLPVFHETAAPRLARELSTHPPRHVTDRRAREGRVSSLEVYGPERGRIRASALVAYGNASRSLLDLDLRRRAAGWRVVALYR